jgi:DnaJ-class molecular chaperone
MSIEGLWGYKPDLDDNKYGVCPDCCGTGKDWTLDWECPTCNGTGEVKVDGDK